MKKSIRVLVVEDDPLVRKAVTRTLVKHIEHVVVAGSAKQALHLLDMLGGQSSFTTILSDYDLGRGKNGEQLLDQVAKLYPNIKRFGMSAIHTNWTSAFERGLVEAVWEKGTSIDSLMLKMDLV